MKCPVCNTECGNDEKCPTCAFDQLHIEFLNREDAETWKSSFLNPYKEHFLSEQDFKDFIILDDTLKEYIGSRETVFIPSNIKIISDRAFHGCKTVKTIIISEKVSSIGTYAFFGCDNLEQISVDKGNSFFTSIDGILFDIKIKRILRFPANKMQAEYDIPNGVDTIGADCFSHCKYLSHINMPHSLLIIGEGAFAGSSLKTRIIIPNSVHTVESAAFFDCDGIAEIVVPPSVKNIGEHSFESLSFSMPAKIITTSGSYVACYIKKHYSSYSLSYID